MGANMARRLKDRDFHVTAVYDANRAVATSLDIELTGGQVRAEGDLDFRGTLGVDRDAPVGFSAVRLSFELDSTADAEQLETLKRLTERYCVVYQTLACSPELTTFFEVPPN